MASIVELSKNYFYETVKNNGSDDPYTLLRHVPLVEAWANRLCGQHPEVNKEIVGVSVWLHDVGYYPVLENIDHAVRGEERAQSFLVSHTADQEIIKSVCHAVRAHRCKDVLPKTIEAKIIAFSDSASHMTDSMYLNIVRDKGNTEYALQKLDRDWRDLAIFPEFRQQLEPLYNSWKLLIPEFAKFVR
jgi:hypothetical protein